MPLNQQIEHRHRKSEAGFKIRPNAVRQMLETTHNGQHRQKGFNQHPGVPLTALAEFQVGRRPIFLSKVRVGKHQHLVRHIIHQVLKSRPIVNIGGVGCPVHHQTQMIKQHTQLATDNPAAVRGAFASDLLVTASLAAGMDQFNPETVNQADQRRFDQKAGCIGAMLLEGTKKRVRSGKRGKNPR